MRGRFYFIMLVLILALAFSSPRANQSRITEEMEKFGGSITRLLGETLKKIPKWKKNRNKARAVLDEIKEFPEPIPTPSPEEIFSWIKELARTEHRRPGSPEEFSAGEYLIAELKKMGIKEIYKEPISVKYWLPKNWKLEIETETGFKNFSAFYVPYSGFTPENGIEAEMVYVGLGKSKEFSKKNVKGKIVVGEVPFPTLPYGALIRLLPTYYVSDPEKSINFGFKERLIFVRQNFLGYSTLEKHAENDIYWNAVAQGAVGVLLILRDQPTNSNTHWGPYDGVLKPMPGMWIGKYDGEELRQMAQKGKRARLTLTGEIQEATTYNIYGILPGQSERLLVIHSHYDAPFQGATEDGAGCAQVLAQAYAWSKIPAEKRPKTLLFLFTTGHFYGSIGSHTFAHQHKDGLLKKADLILTLEHIGAKEAVEDADHHYQFTGRMEIGGIFTAGNKYAIASVIKMLEKHSLPRLLSVPLDFFGPSPPTDTSGFALESGLKVPILSWISGPAYLLCAEDTLDKIEVSLLDDYARAIADLVGFLSLIESEKFKSCD